MSFSFDTYLPRVRTVESGGRDDARNPRSSAGGRYQFIDSTFLNYGRRMFPGLSDQQILARKMDPNAQEQAMKMFTNDNIGILNANRVPVTNASVYGAHFLGPGGAIKLYSSDDNADIASVVGQDVVAANPFLRGKNVAQTKQWLEGKMAGEPQQFAGGDGQATMQGGIGGDQLQPQPEQGGGIMSSIFGGQDGSWNLSDGLMAAGVAAMARDNPQGAAAMARGLTDRQKTAQKRDLRTTYDPSTGRMIVFDPQTGQTQVKELGAPPEKPKELSPSDIRREAEDFKKNDESFLRAANLAEQANKFREAVADGRLKFDPVSQGLSVARNMFNSSDEASRFRNEFNTFKENLRSFQLLAQAGVQTEGDATRALNQFFPQGVYDDKAMLERLDVLSTTFNRDLSRYYDYNKDILSRAGKVKADGGAQYKADTEKRIQSIKDWEDQFQKRRSQPSGGSSGGGSDIGTRFDEWRKNRQ